MRDARSLFSESLIVASWMMVAANPMLAISILMLLSDRHWQTSFFWLFRRRWHGFISAYVLIFWSPWSLYNTNTYIWFRKYNYVFLF
jgi:heme/copper-type cytochrome/quinol oxidase subunit 1